MNFGICVSGAASGKRVKSSCGDAYIVGEAIAKAGHITTTGATIGLPFFAARGAHEAGGVSIGFSPAASLREHIRKYRLPLGVYDYINFTGMHYVGRDIHLVQSSDAVITIGGRMGSLHEFATAIESRMPCGVLLGSGGTADIIPKLMDSLEGVDRKLVVYDKDPVALVKKVILLMEQEYKDLSQTEFDRHEAVFKSMSCDTQANKQHRDG